MVWEAYVPGEKSQTLHVCESRKFAGPHLNYLTETHSRSLFNNSSPPEKMDVLEDTLSKFNMEAEDDGFR